MNPYLSLFAQSVIFMMGVYLQKFIRHKTYTLEQGKKIKMTSRIIICTIFTIILILFNYQQTCQPFSIDFINCFYLDFNLIQIFHVIVANSLLFSTHIYQKLSIINITLSMQFLKRIVIAPLLQQILFRGSFYRTGYEVISTPIMTLFFSLSHLHRPIRKYLKGKSTNWKNAVGQIIFTSIFGFYSFYFLHAFQSVIPSIILHCYCNLLGPPSINKQNVGKHTISILSMITYCYLFV